MVYVGCDEGVRDGGVLQETVGGMESWYREKRTENVMASNGKTKKVFGWNAGEARCNVGNLVIGTMHMTKWRSECGEWNITG